MLPNFLVIGAPKAGTTSIHEYLREHPDVFMSPIKEPHFFCYPSLDSAHGEDSALNPLSEAERAEQAAKLPENLAWYEGLFEGAKGERAVGEVSPQYLGYPNAPKHIHRYIPNAKLIAILRDPAELAYSGYLHAVRDGRGTREEFEAAIEAVLREGYDGVIRDEIYRNLHFGFYHAHLARYHALFPSENLHVCFFDDFKNDACAVMQAMYRFLGVDNSFQPDTGAQYNVSVVPRNVGLYRYFTSANPLIRFGKRAAPHSLRVAAMNLRNHLLARKKPEMEPALRKKLVAIYREDTLRLQKQLQRDLSHWLK